MSTLRRGTHRVWVLMENGKTTYNSWSRCMSSAAPKKISENGNRREKIFKSPFGGTIDYPSIPVNEYIWENVGKWSDKIALKCGATGRKYTYGAARDASNRVARSLRHMGFKTGDVIALVLPNLPETAIAFLGSVEAGLIVTTVNPQYTVDEISKQLINSEAKGVITNAEIAATVLKAAKDSLPEKSPVIVIDDGTSTIPTGSIPFKELMDRGKSLPDVPSISWNPDDVAALPYSSGTTGLPKGVMLTHRNLVNNMEQTARTIDGAAWKPTTETWQDVVPVVLPLFHIYGLNALLLPNLRHGTQLITLPKFTPQLYADVLAKNKSTCLYLVPPLILFLIAAPNIERKYMEHVHALVSGAAPIAHTDVERFYQKYHIDDTLVKFYQGYGMTETSPVTFFQKLRPSKYASIGGPLMDTEARLVDTVTKMDIENPGESGELWVRGSHVMKGYFKNEEATNETIDSEGWLKTGDIAYFDEDFDFYITDRLKELIKVKGFQVAPAELEALLRTHPDVEEAAVVGVPDDRFGEVPKAFILLKKNKSLNEKDVKNFLHGKVAEYKELKGGVTFVDSIPKNPSGKIMRRELKLQYCK